MRNKRIWAKCWACNSIINSQEECYYLHCREGKFNFCYACYTKILNQSKSLFQPERSKREELEISLKQALADFHEKMKEQGNPIIFNSCKSSYAGSATSVEGALYHNSEYFSDCEACKEILSMRCSEHCGNIVREAQ